MASLLYGVRCAMSACQRQRVRHVQESGDSRPHDLILHVKHTSSRARIISCLSRLLRSSTKQHSISGPTTRLWGSPDETMGNLMPSPNSPLFSRNRSSPATTSSSGSSHQGWQPPQNYKVGNEDARRIRPSSPVTVEIGPRGRGFKCCGSHSRGRDSRAHIKFSMLLILQPCKWVAINT